MTSRIIRNEYANNEFVDIQVEEIKNGHCNVCKNIISKEGNRGAFPPDIIFDFVMTDDNFSLETECEEDKYVEEKEEHVKDIEQLSCEFGKSKFKSSTNLKRHD